MRSSCFGAAILLLLVAPATSLRAQNDAAAEAHIRNDCRLAGQVLTTGQPANKRGWAEQMIVHCGREAPPIFAMRWRSVEADTTAVTELLHRSAAIRDLRIFAAAEEVARDRGRSSVARVGAMLLLVRNVDPGNSTWFGELQATEASVRAPRPSMSWGTDRYQEPGSEFLGPVGDRVLAVLQAIAADASEAEAIRHAANVLALTVARRTR